MENWKAMRDSAGLTMQELADAVGWSVGMISDLENHNRGSPRLKKAVRDRLGGGQFSAIENPGMKTKTMYGLRDEQATGGKIPTKEDCLAYLKQYLETCDSTEKIGWTKIVLAETFPLDRWKKDKP